MMISNQEQLLLLFRCLGCGVWLNLTWILLGRIRARWVRTKAGKFVMDAACAILSGVGLFLFALAANSGEFRGAMVVGIALGAYLSHRSLGRWFRALLQAAERGADALHAVSRRLWRTGREIGRKTAKKVELFYKKHLLYKGDWVYNRNNK